MPIVIHEGTGLYFDLTPHGSSVVLDLVGQLWELPLDGGEARPLTDAARDTADDRQPAISPDGRWIATRSDRPGGRGIWIHALRPGDATPLQLTDSALVLGGDDGVPAWLPGGGGLLHHRRGRIVQTDLATRNVRVLAFDSLENAGLDEPNVSPDGRRMLVSGPWPSGSARGLLESAAGAAIWEVDLVAGSARRVTTDSVAARAPAYAPDGHRIAYFTADAGRRFRLVVRESDGRERTVASDPEIEPRRVRWSPDGATLYFVAAGRLRSIPADGGTSSEVPLTARLTVSRRTVRPALHLPAPGEHMPARGFGGIALSPTGTRIAILALGRLWIADAEGAAHAVAEVPVSAARPHWSPDSRTVMWSDGVDEQDDLWATDLDTGRNRRLTELPGVEDPLGWTRDGRSIVFLHDGAIRVLPATDRSPTDSARVLARLRWTETAAFGTTSAWLPGGDTLLVYGMNGWPVASPGCVEAELITPEGNVSAVPEFPCRPSHAVIAADGSLVAIVRGLLVSHPRTAGGWGTGVVLGDVPALLPSTAADGSLVYVAPDGLRLRPVGGQERQLHWPVQFVVPATPPLLIRNARIVALEEGAPAGLSDLLVVDGRIAAIVPAGTLAPPDAGSTSLDAGGRWLLPGLIDTHQHFIDTDVAVLRNALAHGVTTLRDMWGRLSVGAAFRDAVDAGVLEGARVIVSGPPFYPAATTIPVTSEFLWIPTSREEAERGVALLAGMGAGHVKMRYVQSWYAGVGLIAAAHERGLPVSGHCAHSPAVLLAGVDGLEHADGQCGDWEFGLHQDMAELLRVTGVATAPIIYVQELVAQADIPAAARAAAGRRARRAATHTRLLHAAGALLVAGSDAQQEPAALHGELESLVAAGLSPREALLAATRDAAAVVGVGGDLGRVRVGFIADLVIIDADPLEDIRNVRRVHAVIQGGRPVSGATPRGR